MPKKSHRTIKTSNKPRQNTLTKAKKSGKNPSHKPISKTKHHEPHFIEEKTLILGGSSTSLTRTDKEDVPALLENTLSHIHGETMIGDLLVVFPRTREIFSKHGVNFDVEEAGYVYMTINVFSAMHSLKTSSLLEELITISKEVPIPFSPVIVPPRQTSSRSANTSDQVAVASSL